MSYEFVKIVLIKSLLNFMHTISVTSQNIYLFIYIYIFIFIDFFFVYCNNIFVNV